MIDIHGLARHCDILLAAADFNDYCPNGLQVEGGRPVRRLITGVTASQALIDATVAAGGDALLVHHGFFWKGEDLRVIGMKARRIGALLRAGVSLLAYHLPLDAHPELGNNRRLGDLLGVVRASAGGDGDVPVWTGRLPEALDGADLAARVGALLGRSPLHVAAAGRPVTRLAWCTGAAQGFIEEAAALGADCYLSGEISEQTVHQARELGIDYLAAGHHATERYGVQALGERLAAELDLEHRFIDIDNPA
jgi:dinuclear metal center YbgI/SA1388 family protein